VIPDQPQISVWLDIPDTCRMRGEFTGDLDIQVMFGDSDGRTVMQFERLALERFVRLAGELLAVPVPADRKAALPVIASPT